MVPSWRWEEHINGCGHGSSGISVHGNDPEIRFSLFSCSIVYCTELYSQAVCILASTQKSVSCTAPAPQTLPLSGSQQSCFAFALVEASGFWALATVASSRFHCSLRGGGWVAALCPCWTSGFPHYPCWFLSPSIIWVTISLYSTL